jgi:hypothetical protein
MAGSLVAAPSPRYPTSMVGAVITRLETGPLSVEGVRRLIDRLPAETRARLAWAPTELTSSVSSFLDGAMDDSSLSSLVSDLGRVIASIWPAVFSMAEHPELLRSELEAAWRSEASLLRSSLDPGAADAAEWTIRAWIAFVDLSLTLMGAAMEEFKRVLASDPAVIDASATQRGSPLRVQALIMAAIEGVRRGKPQAVVAELVLRAFDEMHTVMEHAQAIGLHIDPFKGETLAERAERARRYAEHVRNALTEDDMRAFEESRLRRLR